MPQCSVKDPFNSLGTIRLATFSSKIVLTIDDALLSPKPQTEEQSNFRISKNTFLAFHHDASHVPNYKNDLYYASHVPCPCQTNVQCESWPSCDATAGRSIAWGCTSGSFSTSHFASNNCALFLKQTFAQEVTRCACLLYTSPSPRD